MINSINPCYFSFELGGRLMIRYVTGLGIAFSTHFNCVLSDEVNTSGVILLRVLFIGPVLQ